MTVIPSGFISKFQELNDSLVSELGKQCLLIYPVKRTACSNCIPNPLTKKSSGVYKAGGPKPFTNGEICPWCDGNGYFEQESTDTITARVYWEVKNWEKLNIPNVRKASDVIEIRGFLTDKPKLLQCEFLQIDSHRFTLSGNIMPYGLVENRYFSSYWVRTN